MLRRIIILLIMLLVFPIHNARAATVGEVRQFADSIGTQVLKVLNSPGISTGQKQSQLRELFSQNVDIPWIGKFVLGQGWQKATPAQQDSYMNAFKNYLLARYTTNFTDFSGSKYTITDVRDQGNGEFTVSMKINSPNAPQQQETDAGYRIHTDDNGQLKISDIIIEGVSLITTQRSEFSAVLQRDGMDALIKDIRNKMQAEQQQKS